MDRDNRTIWTLPTPKKIRTWYMTLHRSRCFFLTLLVAESLVYSNNLHSFVHLTLFKSGEGDSNTLDGLEYCRLIIRNWRPRNLTISSQNTPTKPLSQGSGGSSKNDENLGENTHHDATILKSWAPTVDSGDTSLAYSATPSDQTTTLANPDISYLSKFKRRTQQNTSGPRMVPEEQRFVNQWIDKEPYDIVSG